MQGNIGQLGKVSIHAPHEGERPICRAISASLERFQSTLPTRGSDQQYQQRTEIAQVFQSTLPTRGSDLPAP